VRKRGKTKGERAVKLEDGDGAFVSQVANTYFPTPERVPQSNLKLSKVSPSLSRLLNPSLSGIFYPSLSLREASTFGRLSTAAPQKRRTRFNIDSTFWPTTRRLKVHLKLENGGDQG